MTKCMKINKATGENFQRDKVSVYFCKWEDRKILNETIKVELRNKVIKQFEYDERIKTLGIIMNYLLDWTVEYEYVKRKLIVTILKLMRNKIIPYQEKMYFNVYLLSNVFLVVAQFNLVCRNLQNLKKFTSYL